MPSVGESVKSYNWLNKYHVVVYYIITLINPAAILSEWDIIRSSSGTLDVLIQSNQLLPQRQWWRDRQRKRKL